MKNHDYEAEPERRLRLTPIALEGVGPCVVGIRHPDEPIHTDPQTASPPPWFLDLAFWPLRERLEPRDDSSQEGRPGRLLARKVHFLV